MNTIGTIYNIGTRGTLNAKLTCVTGTLTCAGTVVLNENFFIDTSASRTANLPNESWQIKNVASLTGAYGPTFSVVGWTDAGND